MRVVFRLEVAANTPSSNENTAGCDRPAKNCFCNLSTTGRSFHNLSRLRDPSLLTKWR